MSDCASSGDDDDPEIMACDVGGESSAQHSKPLLPWPVVAAGRKTTLEGLRKATKRLPRLPKRRVSVGWLAKQDESDARLTKKRKTQSLLVSGGSKLVPMSLSDPQIQISANNTATSLATRSRRREARRRENKRKLDQQKPVDNPVSMSALMSAADELKPQTVIDVLPLDQLLKKHPNMTIAGQSIVNAPAQEHTEDPVTKELKAFLQDLPVLSGVNDDLAAAVRTGRARLAILTADHESKLMVSSGTHSHPTVRGRSLSFPACTSGNKCVTVTHARYLPGSPQEGFVGTCLMFPNELDHFYQTGQPPLERRPCIMCCRYAVHRFISALSIVSPTRWKRDKSFIPQCYTNLVDCPGGYKNQFVMLPSADRPVLVGPVAKSYLMYMRAQKRPGSEQWIVDQSALIWYPPGQEEPMLGEIVTSFRKRVVQRLAKDERGRSIADRDFTVPLQRLLRHYELGAQRADYNRLDGLVRDLCLWRAYVAEIGTCADVPAHLYDIARQDCGLRIVDTESCLLYNPRCTHGIHSHIVSKSSPQPCQTRMMGEAVMGALNFVNMRRKRTKQKKRSLMEMLQEFPDNHKPPGTADQQIFLQWVTSSLLGLLPGATIRPPKPVAVAWLKMVHSGQYKGVAQVLCLVRHLCAFAIRERWCHIVNNCMGLRDDMLSIFNFELFSSLVHDTMNSVRRSLSTLTDPDVGIQDVYRVLSSTSVVSMLATAHSSMLVVSYQRPREPLMNTLSSCNREKRGAFVARTVEEARLVGEPGLPLEKLRLLKQWLWKLDPRQHSLEHDVWPHLTKFGASPIGLNHIADTCRRWNHERMGKRELKRIIDTLCDYVPQTVYLCQVVSYFWRMRCHPFSIMLPMNALEDQAAAVSARLGITGAEKGVTEIRGCFYWCTVCNTSYSLMRSNDLPRNEESLIESINAYVRRGSCTTQPHGLTKARNDYRTGQNYCNKDSCSGYMHCNDQPLQKTPLLGQRLTFANGLCVQICAQEGCGLAMQLSARNSVWNHKGPLCSACEMEHTVIDVQTRLAKWGMAYGTSFSCVMCDVSPKSKRTFYYGMGIFVCGTHHNSRVLEAVQRLEGTRMDGRDERISAIVRIHRTISDETRERKLRGIRAELKHSRRQTRGKRGAIKYI